MIKILIVFIGLFSLSNAESDSWKAYRESALLISNNSPKVQELFAIAIRDKNLYSEKSIFDKAIKKNFDAVKYSNIFDFGVDDNTKYKEIMPVVFIIILTGLDYLHTKDWKLLSSEEDMIWSIDDLLKKNKAKILSTREKNFLKQKMLFHFKGKYSLEKQINATNEMVQLLENFVKKRGLHILWFQYNSSDYGMFIVKPEVYRTLYNKKLDEDCSFSIPHFTMEMI